MDRGGTLDAGIQSIKSDGSRHPKYICEKTDELRAKLLPAIAAIVGTFDARQTDVLADKPRWENRFLLLSRQAFDADPIKNSAIKSAYLSELQLANPTDLQAIAENATEEARQAPALGQSPEPKLALLWCAFLAGQQYSDKAGWVGISLAVEIPQQKNALEFIEACRALTFLAHSCYSIASGQVQTGIDKLEMGRTRLALRAA